MTTPAPSRRAILRHPRFALAAAYGTALVATIAVFLAYRVVAHHRTFASRSFFWLGDLHENDDRIGFRMRPNQRGFVVLQHGLEEPSRRIPVRTDARGFRIPLGASDEPEPPGGIAAIGCSCTFAHGVAAESSYVELAGEMLGLPATNLGVCSCSAVTSCLQLEENIEQVRPSIVVYGYGNFHLQRSERPRTDGTLFQAYAADDGRAISIEPPRYSNRLDFQLVPQIERLYYEPHLASRPTPLDATRIRALLPLATQDLLRITRPGFLRLRFEDRTLDETRFCRFILGRMLDLCTTHGARFVLLYFPAYFGESPGPGLQQAVAEHEVQDGFTFVDCSQRLFDSVTDQASYSRQWQVPRDGHPNRFMHLEMARAIVEAVSPATAATRTAAASSGTP